MPTTFSPVSTNDVQWFEQLNRELFIQHPGNGTAKNPPWKETLRDLTPEELKRIDRLIQEHKLPCAMGMNEYGFTLEIFDHQLGKDNKPKLLIEITEGQLPQDMRTARIIADMYTHTPENTEMLAHYGFTPLKAPHHYTY